MTTTRRNYRDGEGKKLPGVTTVLGVLEKPALVPWAARIAAEATAADLSQKLIEFLQSMDVQPQDRGMEFMKNEIALTLGQ